MLFLVCMIPADCFPCYSLVDEVTTVRAMLEKMDDVYYRSAQDYRRCSQTCPLLRICLIVLVV